MLNVLNNTVRLKKLISSSTFTLGFLSFILSNSVEAASCFGWPSGRPIALSITYDDGYPDNLTAAIPDLETYGFRGSFYLATNYVSQYRASDIPQWKQAALKGHEIGSHTSTHECSSLNGGVNPNLATQAAVTAAVTNANTWLNANINEDRGRTFAYPCGETWVGQNNSTGEAAYINVLRQQHIAARWLDPSAPNYRASVKAQPYKLRAYAYDPTTGQTIQDIKNYLDQPTVGTDGWKILIFHNVGTPNSVFPITRADHQEILRYIYSSNKYWVAPVRDVIHYMYRYDCQ